MILLMVILFFSSKNVVISVGTSGGGACGTLATLVFNALKQFCVGTEKSTLGDLLVPGPVERGSPFLFCAHYEHLHVTVRTDCDIYIALKTLENAAQYFYSCVR